METTQRDHRRIDSPKVGMAWEAHSGLKLHHLFWCQVLFSFVGMAWEARSGLKLKREESHDNTLL